MRTAYIYNFLLEANLMASAAVVLMALIRRYLRKPLGSGVLCLGWLLIGIRLLLPLSLPNPFMGELRPLRVADSAIRPIGGQIMVRTRDMLGDLYGFVRVDAGLAEESALATGVRSAYFGMSNGGTARMLLWVYLLGMVLVLGWILFSNVRFRMQLSKNRVAVPEGEVLEGYQALCKRMGVKPVPVYFVDPLASPCLTGVFRPVIALPLTVEKQDVLLTLEHELEHFRRGDHLFALLRLVCCVLHWMNPLVWVGAHLSRVDAELYCDKRVIRHKTADERQQYAGLLVRNALRPGKGTFSVQAAGMSMQGKRLKQRIHEILCGGQAVRPWSITFAALAVIALVMAFATGEFASRVEIPAFDASMLPARADAVDMRSAEEVARAWAASPLIDADMGYAQFRTIRDAADHECYIVQAVPNEKASFTMTVTTDGRIRGFRHWPMDYQTDAGVVHYGQENWYPALSQFVYDVAVHMNPALEGKLETGHICRDWRAGNRRYVYMELPAALQDFQYLCCTVQVLPAFQVLELSGGNG